VNNSIIREAAYFHGYVWPKQLYTGIMFYKGHRITIEQFNAVAAMFKGEACLWNQFF